MSSDHQFSKVLPEKVYSLSILQVAETFEFVLSDERVLHLAELFQVHSEQMVVGVCDLKGKALGFISRVHLLTLLGKPFGRDVLSRKKVSDVLETSVPLDMNANIFQVAEKIQDTMERSILQYYLLTNNEGKYRGIFSSKDLLAYLSKMTHEDVRLAGQLQERLVKNRFALAGEGWSIEAFSQSAKGMGGDFYHVIPLKSGRVFLALGDVSGKGVAASVITSLIWECFSFMNITRA